MQGFSFLLGLFQVIMANPLKNSPGCRLTESTPPLKQTAKASENKPFDPTPNHVFFWPSC